METTTQPAGRARYQNVGLVSGPALAAVLLALPAPAGLEAGGWRTVAFGAMMGVWWATEAVPVAVTALVPIAFFPVFGIAELRAVTAPYANPTIYLFLGGFMVALAVQRWNLHRRIALGVLAVFGGSGTSIVGGFMVASALVSMWVTNTATTMMLLPIATSVVWIVQQNLGDSRDVRENFPRAMMLGVAYGATLGGLATLIGTPPNALLAGFMLQSFQVEIGFAQWMLVGVPLTACLLPLCWWLLTHRLYPVRFSTRGGVREQLGRLRADLGPMTAPEKRVGLVFVCLAAGWLTRPLLSKIAAFRGLSDTGLAVLAAMALFVIPSGRRDEGRGSPFLLGWRDASDLPWGLLLLFGGGLSLAAAVTETGLGEWLGERLIALGLTERVALTLALATLIIFLTEMTSNTATAATFLPVAAAVAVESDYPPIVLASTVALAASCAFMLPVATPPNAVVYGSGMLTIPDMARAGLWLNLIAIVSVTLAAAFLVPIVLG